MISVCIGGLCVFVACLGWFWNLEEVWECLLHFLLFTGDLNK